MKSFFNPLIVVVVLLLFEKFCQKAYKTLAQLAANFTSTNIPNTEKLDKPMKVDTPTNGCTNHTYKTTDIV